MINIWLINQHSYPPGKSNWRRHFDLFKNFSKESYNIDVICGSFVHDRKEDILNQGEKYRLINSEGIKYHILSGISYKSNVIRMLSMIQFFFKVLFFSKKLKDKPSIIYASSPHPFNGLAGMYLARKYKCPFILEIRDLWPETWVAMGATTKKSILYKVFAYIEKVLYKNADKIITLTANKDYYISVGVDEKKVEIVSNGVDLEKYDSLIGERSSIEFLENKFNVLYTGAHGTANCLENILEVAKLLKNDNIVFNLIGEGEKKEELIKKSEECNLKNVKFYSPINKNLIPSTLKKGDAMIVIAKNTPLYKYGISFNKIFEYFASSKPIIFSGNVANDMVKEANAGISVEAENIEKIKEAVLSLYSMSKEQREVLGKNGRKYVEENYDTNVLSKKIEKIILNLLEDKNV
ncbi:glycosyltransferase family 4 protein [Fusobacterium pseudoperiodonticum]|uniref:Glycosyltransferase WbuB n=1 Tax=Fusobacterium pseudoperiodonticum TaxID=2663009 RepID=A0A2G9EEU1_9FUSO|nr:glycosyltransferase family 4 protein [Fusobacterium pseudoperiodonticum]PIM79211.1 glycosyltransferase WbuB [Fusobacterium pseudoperiodonticum]